MRLLHMPPINRPGIAVATVVVVTQVPVLALPWWAAIAVTFVAFGVIATITSALLPEASLSRSILVGAIAVLTIVAARAALGVN